MIYRLGSIGDTVVALPCFNKVRELYPNAHITLLTNEPVSGKAAASELTLRKGEHYNDVIHYPVGLRNPSKIIKLFEEIRSANIDLLINLAADRGRVAAARDKFFFRLLGIREQIGILAENSKFVAELNTPNVSVRLADRLRQIGRPDLSTKWSWNLHLSKQEVEQAEFQLKCLDSSNPTLALAIGTKMQAKDWGLENWKQFVQQFSTSYVDWNLILIGAADDFDCSETVGKFWSNSRVINFCGQLSPRISAAVIQQCHLFVGLDSGPMHLASAVGVPLVAIFSAREKPGEWYPWGQNSFVLYNQTDCFGCGLETCIDNNKKCIESISVNQVLQKVNNVIASLQVIEK